MAGNVIDNAVNTLASPPAPIDQLALAGSAAPHDLSMFTLFMQADTIVKLVLFLLLAASFWSWAVIFDKTTKLRRLHRDAEQFEESFWSGGSLDDLYDRVGERPEDPMSAVFAAAMREWRRSMAKGIVATTARLVFLAAAIAWKLFMMPHTVPKRPTKGEVEPTVARNGM